MSNMGRCGQHGCAFSVRLVVNGQRDEYCPECEIDRLRADVARLQQERKGLISDRGRLDWLDSLSIRTEYQNKRVPHRYVSSDLHFDYGQSRLYVRNQEGRAVACGEGAVREAIDKAREVLANRPAAAAAAAQHRDA